MSEGPGRGDPGDDAVRVGGGFDLSHLQAVHRRLFDGVDPEAGRLRTVDPPAPAAPGDRPDGEVVTAVHQNHDYSHASGGAKEVVWTGPEAAANLKLAGGPDRQFTLYDANLLLTPKGLVPAAQPEHLRRAKQTRLLLFSLGLHDLWNRLNVEWESLGSSRMRIPGRRDLLALALRIRYFSVRYAVRNLLSRSTGVDDREGGR